MGGRGLLSWKEKEIDFMAKKWKNAPVVVSTGMFGERTICNSTSFVNLPIPPWAQAAQVDACDVGSYVESMNLTEVQAKAMLIKHIAELAAVLVKLDKFCPQKE
jgi:hypothetical protein